MRHRVKGRTLGVSPSHRRAMLRNLTSSLVLHERVVTTLARAKEARPFAEKMITLGKQGTLHARRLAIQRLHDKDAVAKIFDDLAKRCASRAGGYLRILRLDARRLGDNASQVIFELVDRRVEAVVADEQTDKQVGKSKA